MTKLAAVVGKSPRGIFIMRQPQDDTVLQFTMYVCRTEGEFCLLARAEVATSEEMGMENDSELNLGACVIFGTRERSIPQTRKMISCDI